MDAIPTYRRQRMVDAVHAGEPLAQVARRFEVSETCVRNYLKRAEEGSLEPKPRSGGPPPSLDEEQRRRLQAAVDEQPDATLEELVEQCGLPVSPSTVCRELKKMDRSRKRKVPRAAEQNEEHVREQRAVWSDFIDEIDPKRLIFIDEFGISTHMTRRYGRAPEGVPIYTDVPYRHYDALTVLGGMRLGGRQELPMMAYEGGTTVEHMLAYIDGPLGDILRPDDIVVADNLTSHHSDRVEAAVHARQADIWFLPPYSPDLNPIERMWSKLKTSLRAAKATTIDRLMDGLRSALETVTNSNIYNWFAHSLPQLAK